jgi:hypothetical protein
MIAVNGLLPCQPHLSSTELVSVIVDFGERPLCASQAENENP